MASTPSDVVDVTEIFLHGYAGRAISEVSISLGRTASDSNECPTGSMRCANLPPIVLAVRRSAHHWASMSARGGLTRACLKLRSARARFERAPQGRGSQVEVDPDRGVVGRGV